LFAGRSHRNAKRARAGPRDQSAAIHPGETPPGRLKVVLRSLFRSFEPNKNTDAPSAAQPQLARGEQAEANELSPRITRINTDKSRDRIALIREDEASGFVAKP